MRPSGIGGQAVIEGVMMKNKDEYAIAVRKPDNEIEVVNQTHTSLTTKNKFFALPIVRGVIAFVDSLVIGMKTITYSASFYEEEEELTEKQKEKKAKKEAKKESSGKAKKEEKESSDTLFMALTVCLSVVLAVGIFILLPLWISALLTKQIESNTVLAILEGLIRLGIFVIYIVAISQMKDIQRVFMYHGAEHKTINCIEHGHELTVENVRTQSREHKRCGTSFLLFVIIISSIVFIFIRFDNILVKTLARLLLVPVIAGISYEVIKLAGKSESKLVAIISRPGMWMQRLTTKEPTDDMIEVAIKSVEAVFDWRAFLQEEEVGSEVSTSEESITVMQEKPMVEETAATMEYNDFFEEEEEDEILRAVDKYFISKDK